MMISKENKRNAIQKRQCKPGGKYMVISGLVDMLTLGMKRLQLQYVIFLGTHRDNNCTGLVTHARHVKQIFYQFL